MTREVKDMKEHVEKELKAEQFQKVEDQLC